LLRTLAEFLHRLALHLGFELLAPLTGKRKTGLRHRHAWHLSCRLTDLDEVPTFDHQIGLSLPGHHPPLVVVAWVDAKAATAHLQRLRLHLRAKLGQSLLHHGLELGLHRGRLVALLAGAQLHAQPVLRRILLRTGAQAEDLGWFGHNRRLRLQGTAKTQQRQQ